MANRESENKFFSKVSLNMVTNIIRVIAMALVGFLMVPYYIDQFGQATYALLPLATSITTYVLIASESLADSFARFLILTIQGKDTENIDRTFSSSVIGMLRLILILLPIVFLISILSPFIFSTGDAGQFDVQMMFFLVLVSALLVSFTTCLNSVYMAYNQLYVMYIFRTVHCVLQVALVLLFFFIEGPSLIFLGISYLIAAILLIIALVIGIKKIDPALKVHRKAHDKALVKEMSGLGLWAMMTRLGNILFIQTSQIVVNICLGSSIQTEFSIAANIVSMITTVCSAITAVGVPLAYKHYHNEDSEKMRTTLDIFTRFTGLIMVFPLAFICVFAPQLLTAWLGSTYNVITLMFILVPACVSRCALEVLCDIPILYARAKDLAVYTLITGALNVILALTFIEFTDLGVIGVCIAWDVSVLILNFVFIPPFISRLMGISRFNFYKPLIVNYIAFGALIGLGWILIQFWTMPYRWLAIIITMLIGFLIYFAIILNIGLKKSEKNMVATFVPEKIQNILFKIAPSFRQ